MRKWRHGPLTLRKSLWNAPQLLCGTGIILYLRALCGTICCYCSRWEKLYVLYDGWGSTYWRPYRHLLCCRFRIWKCAGSILWNASTPPRQPNRLCGFEEHKGCPFLFGSVISWEYPIWKGYLVSHCKDAEIIKREPPCCRVNCSRAVSFSSYLPA